jgi:hypothetical protein
MGVRSELLRSFVAAYQRHRHTHIISIRASRLSPSGCSLTRLGRYLDSIRIPTNQYDSSYYGLSSCTFTCFLGFVLLKFFLVWFKCSLTVASDFSIYFYTCSGVSVGQVVKFPAFIAFMNVYWTREPSAACKYCMASYTLLISNTLFINSFFLVLFSSNSTAHNPVVWSRCPCMTIRPYTATLPSITCACPSSNSTLYPASHFPTEE